MIRLSTSFTLLSLAAAALFALPVSAQTSVTEAWIRGTVPQQKATGAFMQLESAKGGKLLSASSPAAGVVELHSMAMEGSTMRMRAVPSVDLPARTRVELRPGGLHVMLMDLKAPLKTGDAVPLSLVIEGKDGKRETVVVKATVRALGADAAAPKH
jgi:copper(I)-binding protein